MKRPLTHMSATARLLRGVLLIASARGEDPELILDRIESDTPPPRRPPASAPAMRRAELVVLERRTA